MLTSNFYGVGEYSNRKASVFIEGGAFVVLMIENEQIWEERTIEGHSLQYAEDCAENFVLGVI